MTSDPAGQPHLLRRRPAPRPAGARRSELVAQEGPSAVSLRSLARRLGVSHAAPANHFPDKASLFTAIAVEGFRLLAAGHRATAPGGSAPTPPPASGSARPAAPTPSFALAHPAHFAVMWQRDLLHQDDPELAAAGDTTFELLLDSVRDVQAEGWAPGRDPQTVALPGLVGRARPGRPVARRLPPARPSAPSTRSPARSAPSSAAPSVARPAPASLRGDHHARPRPAPPSPGPPAYRPTQVPHRRRRARPG